LPEVKKGDRIRYIVLSNLNIKEVVLMRLKKAALGGAILFLVLWLIILVKAYGSEVVQAIWLNPSSGQEFQVKKMQDEFARIVGNHTALEPEYFKTMTVDIAKLILDVE